MDYMNITVQEISNRWQELSADYNEKISRFMEAWHRFMNDCNARDRKVEERKAAMLEENQTLTQQLESLGTKYTAFMLDGQEKSAADIKEQMTEISAMRSANEVLIGSLGKAAYSESLLQEAEEAFEAFGEASMMLTEKKPEIRDAIDSIVDDLNKLQEKISYAGDSSIEEKYCRRMYQRYNHQPEQEW